MVMGSLRFINSREITQPIHDVKKNKQTEISLCDGLQYSTTYKSFREVLGMILRISNKINIIEKS